LPNALLSSVIALRFLVPQTRAQVPMSEFLNRFTFQLTKLTTQVWAAAIAIWLAVLICAIASIRNQPFSRRQRLVWYVLVTVIPIFGLLAYLPFSIRRDELPTAFLGRVSSKDRKRSSQRQLSVPPSPRA
jgi:hypothetical protein